jgi:hypothetical protein
MLFRADMDDLNSNRHQNYQWHIAGMKVVMNTAGRARDADARRLNSGGKDEDGGGAGVKGSNCTS